MRKVWKKVVADIEEIKTVKNIEVLLAGKPIRSMGSKQSKIEAAYDYSRMNMIMGTDSNISNSCLLYTSPSPRD